MNFIKKIKSNLLVAGIILVVVAVSAYAFDLCIVKKLLGE